MTFDPKQELQYLHGLRDHDPKVVAAIYEQCAPIVLRFVLRHGGSPSDAQDLFQEGMMILLRKAQQDDFQLTAPFAAYLLGVCKHIHLKKSSKKGLQTVTIEPEWSFIEEEIDWEAEWLRRERYDLYRSAMQQLGDVCQQLLTLFFDKVSMREIGKRLGLESEQATRTRKYRCQKRLEAVIKADPRYSELKHAIKSKKP